MKNELVLKKLIQRVKDHNILLRFQDYGASLGRLDYLCITKKFIIFCNTLDSIKRIATIAHEFGHFLDFDLNGDDYHARVTSSAVICKITQHVTKDVMDAEIQAWDYADAILTEIGFDVGNRGYQRIRKRCLNSYIFLYNAMQKANTAMRKRKI